MCRRALWLDSPPGARSLGQAAPGLGVGAPAKKGGKRWGTIFSPGRTSSVLAFAYPVGTGVAFDQVIPRPCSTASQIPHTHPQVVCRPVLPWHLFRERGGYTCLPPRPLPDQIMTH